MDPKIENKIDLQIFGHKKKESECKIVDSKMNLSRLDEMTGK